MLNKLIEKSDNLEDKTILAVDLISDPIRQTMSPMGGNVMYEDASGRQQHTNDGATIAKQINHKDPFVNQIISVIRDSSLKTNMEAGDGTSSTILFSGVLIKEGLRLLRNEWNQIEIRNEFERVGDLIRKEIVSGAIKIKDDKDLLHIANVSSSNNKEIAENTVKTIKVTGKEGQVMIEAGFSPETTLIEDSGFILNSGLFSPEFAQNKTFSSKLDEVPVLITDKRLYYESEAEQILNTALMNGFESVVIIASDFIGEALPYFAENHRTGTIKVILIKETRREILEDLAIYLGGEVISDKSGSLDNLEISDFAVSKMVFANNMKSIISRDKKEFNPGIAARVAELEKQMKEVGNKNDGDYKAIERRIASLTKGMVTIKVGGRTNMEINEKIFRYEDAINATKIALDEGYVIGGGVTIYNAWKKVASKNKIDKEIYRVFDKLCKETIRQISINCGVSPEVNLAKLEEVQGEFGKTWGFNALKGKMTNLLEDGIIEPVKVATQVLDNAISITNAVITSRYRIVNDLEEDNNK
jgi:chaperonin GroEL